MYLITAFLLSLSLGVVLGSNCQNLSGLWRNQLGSNMTVIHGYDINRFTGKYSTAVETKHKASLVSSNITGMFMPVNEGALFSFTVLFNHGKSLTTWVGQCNVCDGEETLFTTWVLRSHSLKPVDRWMANIIHQDTFKRVKGNEINRLDFGAVGPSAKEERDFRCEKNIEADLSGRWISHTGDSLSFSDCYESGVFTGFNVDNPMVGRTDGGGLFTAMGFASMSSKSVKGWTGHIHESATERRKLETSWLTQSFSRTCKSPRALVNHGIDDYTFTYGSIVSGPTVEPKTSWTNRLMNYVSSFF